MEKKSALISNYYVPLSRMRLAFIDESDLSEDDSDDESFNLLDGEGRLHFEGLWDAKNENTLYLNLLTSMSIPELTNQQIIDKLGVNEGQDGRQLAARDNDATNISEGDIDVIFWHFYKGTCAEAIATQSDMNLKNIKATVKNFKACLAQKAKENKCRLNRAPKLNYTHEQYISELVWK